MVTLSTGTAGNYYFTLASVTTGNAALVGNAAILANLSTGILYATKFSGDGGLLSNLSGGSSIVNGTSNVLVDSSANVRTSVAGNANIIIATGTGANVNGYLTVAGGNITTTGSGGNITGANVISANTINVIAANLGAVGNLIITGGTLNYVLSTNGSGGLSWVAAGGAATMTAVTLDFGTTPCTTKTFSITDAAAVTTNKILMHSTALTTGGSLGGDELDCDNFICTAYCAVNGTIIAMIRALPGPVRDKRTFMYSLG